MSEFLSNGFDVISIVVN